MTIDYVLNLIKLFLNSKTNIYFCSMYRVYLDANSFEIENYKTINSFYIHLDKKRQNYYIVFYKFDFDKKIESNSYIYKKFVNLLNTDLNFKEELINSLEKQLL